MNLFEQTLADLKKGELVRITQKNGDVLEGIITENDGGSAIAVQIAVHAVIRYDQITAVSKHTAAAVPLQVQPPVVTKPAAPAAAVPTPPKPAPVIPHVQIVPVEPVKPVPVPEPTPAPAPQPVPAPVPAEVSLTKSKIPTFQCTADTIHDAWKSISSENHKPLNAVYNSFINGIQSRNTEKMEQAVQRMQLILNDDDALSMDEGVNLLYAEMLYMTGSVLDACTSFYDAKAYRQGYLTAYEHQEYNDAAVLAAYSVIHAEDKEYLQEAFAVLTAATMANEDATALHYLYHHTPTEQYLYQGHNMLMESVKRIAQRKNLPITSFFHPAECLQQLSTYFTKQEMEETFQFYQRDEDEVTIDHSADETPSEEPATDETDVIPAPQPGVLKGRIVSSAWLREGGKIEMEDGTTYNFSFADLSKDLHDTLIYVGSNKRELIPIAVTFKLKGKKPVSIERSVLSYVELLKKANGLVAAHKFEEAIKLTSTMMNAADPDDAIVIFLKCHMSLRKESGNQERFAKEVLPVLDKYVPKMKKNINNYVVVQQVYTTMHMHQEELGCLDTILSLTDPENYKRVMQYVLLKSACCQKLGRLQEAIDLLEQWIALWNQHHVIEQYHTCIQTVYPKMIELYTALGDEEQAEACRKIISKEAEKMDLDTVPASTPVQQEKPPVKPEPQPEPPAPEKPEKPELKLWSAEELQPYFDAYEDRTGFAGLACTEADILQTAGSFGMSKVYCTLAYLKAAASIQPTLEPIYQTISYAHDNPMEDCQYGYAQIHETFRNRHELMPAEEHEGLRLAAILRAAFTNENQHDYLLPQLTDDLQLEEGSPRDAVHFVLEQLFRFRTETGYGMEAIAAEMVKKQSGPSIDSIVADALEMRDTTFSPSNIVETAERLRRTRKYLFVDKSSLRRCFDAVCENDTARAEEVRSILAEKFMRANQPVGADAIDNRKIDSYIDKYWDLAATRMRKDGMQVEQSSDFMSSKRNNVAQIIIRTVKLICTWLDAAAQQKHENLYAERIYREMQALLVQNLQQIGTYYAARAAAPEHLGSEAASKTVQEILAKLDGSYDYRSRKYTFIDFLRSNQLLLNMDFLPELQSTFCDLPQFNVLTRIAAFAKETALPTFAERVAEIFRNEDITKVNLRTAYLIYSYAEDMGIEEITTNPMFQLLQTCIEQTKKRIQLLQKSFMHELAWSQSCGRISDIQGEKTRIAACAETWYEITTRTYDFGFYVQLLNAFLAKISENAEAYGESLMRQLKELFSNPQLQQGIYSEEEIADFIRDQNYTVAENMMNCIRRGDVAAVKDYSLEASTYLEGFLQEYYNIYSIVSNQGVTLSKAIKRATKHAPMKNVRGGSSLIDNWIICGQNAGEERISRLLSLLGWTGCTPTKDTSYLYDDVYNVTKERIRGKANYPHPIPAFSSIAEEEGFRVLCLYGTFTSDALLDKFKDINQVSMHTLVLLDFSLTEQERRHLARKIKEEKSFSRTFIVIDRVLLFYLAKHYSINAVNRMLMAAAMPFAYYQPFQPESSSSNTSFPPELFAGRVAELTEIEDANGANLVYGGRQLGKSALLAMAAKNIDKNAVGSRAIVIDLFGKDYTAAALKVSQELVDAGILSPECECDDWDQLTRHIKQRLADETPSKKIPYLLLMLDEADAFIASCKDVVYAPISALKDIQSAHFKFVLAGTHDLIRYDRDKALGNNSTITHLKSITVRPFKTPEATELLTHTLSYLGLRFRDQSMISMILASTNYFPVLIQLYCQKLLETMKNADYAGYDELYAPPYEVTEEHIKSVLSDQGFTDMIKEKLEATLFLDKDQGSYYHILALLIAYLSYETPSDMGYDIYEIQDLARQNGIPRIYQMDAEKITELLNEMCDLNVLGNNDGKFIFSSKNFRELIGSFQGVANKLADYIGQEENA